MRNFGRLWRALVVIAAPAFLAAGCGTTGGFDTDAYRTDVDLKYETLSLLDNATTRYAAHKAAAEALLQKYAAAADKAAKNAGNTAIVAQWAAIRDPRGTSAGNAIELWKKAPLRVGQRAEKKRAIAAHFDHLICLEQHLQECGDAGLEATPGPSPTPVAAPRRPAPAATPAPSADEPPPDSDSEPGEKPE